MSQNSNVVCFEGSKIYAINSHEELEELLNSSDLQINHIHVKVLNGRGITVPADRIYSV